MRRPLPVGNAHTIVAPTVRRKPSRGVCMLIAYALPVRLWHLVQWHTVTMYGCSVTS